MQLKTSVRGSGMYSPVSWTGGSPEVKRSFCSPVYCSVPSVQVAATADGDFKAGLLCCGGGPVGVQLAVSRRGYTVGDTVEFRVDVDNQSRKKLHEVKVALVQVTETAPTKQRGGTPTATVQQFNYIRLYMRL